MNTESQVLTAPSIKGGHMIDLGPRHSIALHERNGHWWAAEFRDGHGELIYAGAWFRFHAGGLRYCHNGRAAVPSSAPLTPDMLEKIERLHRESEAREERMMAVPRAIAAAAQRYANNVLSRLSRRAIRQTSG